MRQFKCYLCQVIPEDDELKHFNFKIIIGKKCKMKLKHVQTGKIVSGTIIWKESSRKDDEHSFNGIIFRRGPCVVWYDPQNNRWNEDFLNEYVGPHHEKQAAFIPV